MTKKQEKGKVGAVAQYITQSKSLKKLQLSLADFRQLCILKGIYPRSPQTKKDGSDKIYYHVRDIRLLAQDPLRMRVYDDQAQAKKHSKLVGRGAFSSARKIESNTSSRDLSHVIRERYPTFNSALMDLDDCLSTLAVVSVQSLEESRSLDAKIINDCKEVYQDFLAFVASKGCLTKMFASIKGFYMRAELADNIAITWLHPHEYTSEKPLDVDIRVIASFTEWYRTLQRFVNFKLFAEAGFQYPLPSGTITKKCTVFQVPVDKSQLFKDLVVFVSREVPFIPVFMALKSAGASVRWAEDSYSSTASSEGITHVISDRPTLANILPDRDYVQPQWVLDSLNEGIILSADEYKVGKGLPPHLSPFSGTDGDYLPQRRMFLDELKLARLPKVSTTTDAPSMESTEAEFLADISSEANVSRPIRKRRVTAVEDRQSAIALLSKKHRRLLDKIESGKATKRRTADVLRAKASKVSL